MVYKIKDNIGRNYEIKDIDRFIEHIFKFHAIGSSLHEENGYYFTINDKFRKKMNDLKNKKTVK